MHPNDGSKELVSLLHEHGLIVPYDEVRVAKSSAMWLYNKILVAVKQLGVLAPHTANIYIKRSAIILTKTRSK